MVLVLSKPLKKKNTSMFHAGIFHMGRFQIYLNFNQLIRLRSHMERLHGVELMEAMAGFHTFDKVMILLLGKRINEIHRA